MFATVTLRRLHDGRNAPIVNQDIDGLLRVGKTGVTKGEVYMTRGLHEYLARAIWTLGCVQDDLGHHPGSGLAVQRINDRVRTGDQNLAPGS